MGKLTVRDNDAARRAHPLEQIQLQIDNRERQHVSRPNPQTQIKAHKQTKQHLPKQRPTQQIHPRNLHAPPHKRRLRVGSCRIQGL